MAGLLAWAADVVGGGGQSNDEDESNRFPVVKFTPEQQIYARDLEVKAASLSRSIQDLRLRLPPPDISQRLPHLHAHSLASNAALALQLNAHSATREEAQLREAALQEENAAYEKAITNCEKRIQEKLQEADMLQSKLQNSMEEKIKGLEEKWTQVQHDSLRKLSPAQREKILDKQLHSSIEQLAAKQAQAEGLVSEIHLKKLEFEKLNGLWKRLESGNTELNTARNRFVGSSLGRGSSDYIIDSPSRPSHVGGRTESQQRLMLLRSAFVLYILFLHVLVFIKISF
ncbi:uncharacterized protein LOC122650170 isoform X2 [Telopea speciosissima]|uniref:uncharacterized protein LOC122650170 isoform X2 n=1 Tax=Telopea speciosissima TaxID=54955 RepID=UPI001CC5AF76|nr:uncharacterized protein LOC122650170 isoform X2 [Telopea speciosissima]